MGKITSITPQVKDKNRCNIYIDNNFYCGLQLQTVLERKLKVGDVVEEKDIAVIQFDSEKNKAFDKCLTYITKAIKTQKQVITYLKGKGYCDAVIFYCIEKLKEYKFIDDGEYANNYVSTYKDKKGKKLIAYELRLKGVGEEEIEKALGKDDQKRAIMNLAQKYLKNKELTKEILQKLYRHLASKGFDYEEINSVMSEIKGGLWNEY